MIEPGEVFAVGDLVFFPEDTPVREYFRHLQRGANYQAAISGLMISEGLETYRLMMDNHALEASALQAWADAGADVIGDIRRQVEQYSQPEPVPDSFAYYDEERTWTDVWHWECYRCQVRQAFPVGGGSQFPCWVCGQQMDTRKGTTRVPDDWMGLAPHRPVDHPDWPCP